MATIDVLPNLDSLIPWFIHHEDIWMHYDREADVLYLHFKKPNQADNGELTDDDMIVRYENGEVIGLTIMHASTRTALP